MSPNDIHRTIDAVWRIESARLIARLTRIVRDIGQAEELAHDALVAALEQWPTSGVPGNPGAWLMTAAKNRAIDLVRRKKWFASKQDEVGRQWEAQRMVREPNLDDLLDDEVGDELLRLIFMTCHPVLSSESRVALTLRPVMRGLQPPTRRTGRGSRNCTKNSPRGIPRRLSN